MSSINESIHWNLVFSSNGSDELDMYIIYRISLSSPFTNLGMTCCGALNGKLYDTKYDNHTRKKVCDMEIKIHFGFLL